MGRGACSVLSMTYYKAILQRYVPPKIKLFQMNYDELLNKAISRFRNAPPHYGYSLDDNKLEAMENSSANNVLI